MIIFTKIIAIIIGLMVVSKTYYDFKKHYESLTMFIFWSVTWLVIIAAAVLPDFFLRLAEKVSGNGVGLGTFAGVAFIFLLFVTYRVYTKANRLEKKMHDMVMKLGLKEIEKDE